MGWKSKALAAATVTLATVGAALGGVMVAGPAYAAHGDLVAPESVTIDGSAPQYIPKDGSQGQIGFDNLPTIEVSGGTAMLAGTGSPETTIRVLYATDALNEFGNNSSGYVYTVVNADGTWEVAAPITSGLFGIDIGTYLEDLETVQEACTEAPEWWCSDDIDTAQQTGNFYAHIVEADLPDLDVPPELDPAPETPGEPSAPERTSEQPGEATPLPAPIIETRADVTTAEQSASLLPTVEPTQYAQQSSVQKHAASVHAVTTSLSVPQPPNPVGLLLGTLLASLGAAAAVTNRVLHRRSR